MSLHRTASTRRARSRVYAGALLLALMALQLTIGVQVSAAASGGRDTPATSSGVASDDNADTPSSDTAPSGTSTDETEAPATDSTDAEPDTSKPKSAFEKRLPTPAELDIFLAGKGSPMAGQGAAFVSSGARWKVDPRLLVAIAGAESAFGQITCAPFNGWGWGCPNGPYEFTSWADGIETVTRGLRVGYLAEGRTSVVLIQQKYAPSGAANDPTGLNNNWVTNVSKYLIELGGDPDDVDLNGVAGTRPLGLEFDPLAQAQYDFFPSGTDDDASQSLTIRRGAPESVQITIRNTGSQEWKTDTVRLRRVDIEPRVASAPFAVLAHGPIKPQKTATFTVELAAIGYQDDAAQTLWRLEGPGGPFGPEIKRSVVVDVGGFAARAEDRPDFRRDSNGQVIVIVRFRNVGEDEWIRDGSHGVVLGVVGDADPGWATPAWISESTPSRLLERSVEPGEIGSFAAPLHTASGSISFLPTIDGQHAAGRPAVVASAVTRTDAG